MSYFEFRIILSQYGKPRLITEEQYDALRAFVHPQLIIDIAINAPYLTELNFSKLPMSETAIKALMRLVAVNRYIRSVALSAQTSFNGIELLAYNRHIHSLALNNYLSTYANIQTATKNTSLSSLALGAELREEDTTTDLVSSDTLTHLTFHSTDRALGPNFWRALAVNTRLLSLELHVRLLENVPNVSAAIEAALDVMQYNTTLKNLTFHSRPHQMGTVSNAPNWLTAFAKLPSLSRLAFNIEFYPIPIPCDVLMQHQLIAVLDVSLNSTMDDVTFVSLVTLMPQLRHLHARFVGEVTNAGIDAILALNKLVTLDISGNHIYLPTFTALANNTQLRHLIVNDTTSSIPHWNDPDIGNKAGNCFIGNTTLLSLSLILRLYSPGATVAGKLLQSSTLQHLGLNPENLLGDSNISKILTDCRIPSLEFSEPAFPLVSYLATNKHVTKLSVLRHTTVPGNSMFGFFAGNKTLKSINGLGVHDLKLEGMLYENRYLFGRLFETLLALGPKVAAYPDIITKLIMGYVFGRDMEKAPYSWMLSRCKYSFQRAYSRQEEVEVVRKRVAR